MATYYWVGGSGTWNTSTTTNWAASSGGAGGAGVPTSADNVIIDTSSGTGTITCTAAVCNDITVTASQAITLGGTSNSLSVYGSLTFPSGGFFQFAAAGANDITFAATTTGKTITLNGKQIQAVNFNGVGGEWTLGSAFTSGGGITLTNGSFITNNYNITCSNFNLGAGTKSLTLGTSTVTLEATGTLWNLSANNANLTFSGASSTIVLSDTSTIARTFTGGNFTYGTLTIGGTTGTSFTNIVNSNTFAVLNSTKTVAHTINFNTASSTNTIGTWNVTGTAGNVVRVYHSFVASNATVNITNRTSGIDYLDISRLTFNRTPVTFYAGANSILRDGVIGAACITPTVDEYIYVLDSGTSFTVPADWNNSNNEIHLFAGGGGGGASRDQAGGGGGGGAGYTKATNVTLSGSISYAIGAGGVAGSGSGVSGGAGGNTTFNSGAITTTGGGGGSTTATPSSVGGASGTGSTFNGGVGGLGSTSAPSGDNGGGGGGGAGGPLGNGGSGGNGFSAAAASAGGGGGGNGGGTNGGNASSNTGGTGGNNNSGVGGGASGTSGFNGGGGGGQPRLGSAFVASGSGVDIAKAGMGGGAGGPAFAAFAPTNSRAGLFGGGGCGGGTSGATVRAGAAGMQGGIVIFYATGSAPVANSNFFLMFG